MHLCSANEVGRQMGSDSRRGSHGNQHCCI